MREREKGGREERRERNKRRLLIFRRGAFR